MSAGFDPFTIVAQAQPEVLSGSIPVSPPIYQTATFSAMDAETFQVMATQPLHSGFYTRHGNPTTRAFEDAVARLEGGEAGLSTASGMGAMVAALLALVSKGEHVLAQTLLYGGTMGLLKNIAPRLGIDVTFADPADPQEFISHATSNTKLIIVESPTNPMMTITDLRGIARLAKEKGILTLVDNTIASPINQRPIELGIDIVMHSATKYLSGHADVSAGVLVASKAIISSIWDKAYILGATLDPFAAWLSLRGLRTLPMRVDRQNAAAMEVATYLSKHKNVECVHFPGLASHPQHELACEQMSGFGGVLSFEVRGGAKAAELVLAGLQLAQRSGSFGSFSTLVVHPAAVWAGLMTDEQLKEIGLPTGLIRFSVGFEDPGALIADLDHAFRALG